MVAKGETEAVGKIARNSGAKSQESESRRVDPVGFYSGF